MSSLPPPIALGRPHQVQEWNEGPTYFCTLAVTMPNGSIESFRGKGQSASAARVDATFTANYEINLLAFPGGNSNGSSESVNPAYINKPQLETPSSQYTPGAAERPVDIDPTLLDFGDDIHDTQYPFGHTPNHQLPSQSDLDERYPSVIFSDDHRVARAQANLDTSDSPPSPATLVEPANHQPNHWTPPLAPDSIEVEEIPKAFRDDSAHLQPPPAMQSQDKAAMQRQDKAAMQQQERKSALAIASSYSQSSEESSDDESAESDAEVKVLPAVPSPNNKLRHGKASSRPPLNQLEHHRNNTVQRKQSPVTLSVENPSERKEEQNAQMPQQSTEAHYTGLVKPSTQRTQDTPPVPLVKPSTQRTQETPPVPSERIEAGEIRALITYSDDENDILPPAREPTQTNIGQPAETPGSPLEQGQIRDNKNAYPTPAWLSKHRDRQQHGSGAPPPRNPQQAQNSLPQNPAGRWTTNIRSAPQFSSGRTSAPHIIEPRVPSNNKREAPVFAGGISAEQLSRPVPHPSRSYTEGIAGPFPGPPMLQDNGTRHANYGNPQWMTRISPPISRIANPPRASSSMPPSQGGRHVLNRIHGGVRSVSGPEVNSTSTGMNQIPIPPAANMSSIPVPPNGQMPIHPPQAPVYPHAGFVPDGPCFSAPFQVPHPHYFTAPLQHQQFTPLPHSVAPPYMYGPSMSGVPFPFGPNCKEDMEAKLATIRRAAIANAQAAVEKDLQKTFGADGLGGPLSGADGQILTRDVPDEVDAVTNTNFHRNKTDFNGDLDLGKKRGRRDSENDNQSSRKRQKIPQVGETEVTQAARRSPPPHIAANALAPSVPAAPSAPNCVPAVVEHSSGDELDGGEHISALHELVQKLKVCKSLKYDFDRSSERNNLWVCRLRVTRVNQKVGDKPLEVAVASRTKQLAKRKASKRMFIVLKEMFPGDNAAMKPAKSIFAAKTMQAKTDPKSPAEGGSLTTAAVGALNELWLCKTLENQPDARLQAVDGAMWKCTFLLKVANHGLVQVSEEGPSKKVAKRFAAHKALDILKELPGTGARRFSRVKSLAEAREAEAASLQEIPEETNKEAMEEAVKLSDDENYKAQEQEHFDETDGLFVLPKGYLLTIAQSSEDCDEWAKEHLREQTEIGMFLDKWDTCGDSVVESDPNAIDEQKAEACVPVFCLSTGEAGLAVRADMCKDGDLKENDMFDGLWLPRAIRSVLRDRELLKHGHEFDVPMMSLWEEFGIRARGLNDVAVTSFAVNGFSRSYGNKILWTIAELNKYWLQKEGVAKSWKGLWADSRDAPVIVSKEGNYGLGVAALYAYGCLQINERVKVAAKRKRTQLYGSGAEFDELCKRLMHCPFP